MKRLSDSCRHFDRNQSAFLDGQLPAEVRRKVAAHLTSCSRCRERASSNRDIRAVLRTMPAVPTPPNLKMRLRVTASRELARRRAHASFFERWLESVRLWMENMMRPLALPAAGGVLSALVLFGIIAPTLAVRGAAADFDADVPTGLYTEASVKATGVLGFDLEDLEIELTIDEQGRMVDYLIPDEHRLKIQQSPELRRSLENTLMFTEFNPATSFGQKTSGKIRLRLRSSSIDVKG